MGTVLSRKERETGWGGGEGISRSNKMAKCKDIASLQTVSSVEFSIARQHSLTLRE